MLRYTAMLLLMLLSQWSRYSSRANANAAPYCYTAATRMPRYTATAATRMPRYILLLLQRECRAILLYCCDANACYLLLLLQRECRAILPLLLLLLPRMPRKKDK